MSLPLPPPLSPDAALFLDFDGTLVDLAPRPDAVVVRPALPALLAQLARQLGGALALVSGRPIVQLDAWLAPLQLPAAGLHGAERRSAEGLLYRQPEPDLDAVCTSLEALVAQHPGLVLERKRGAVALHYRLAPSCQSLVEHAMQAALAHTPGMELVHGKRVVEMKPAGSSKGRAVQSFLAEAPFAGRHALFAGDDLTDEDAFAAVQARGGAGIKVGDGPTRARFRLASPLALSDWLSQAQQPADARTA